MSQNWSAIWPRKTWERLLLPLLFLLSAFITGCGVNSSQGSKPGTPGPTPTLTPSTIVFDSTRALDGSDTSSPGHSNLWSMKFDGSGAVPLTKLTSSIINSFSAAWSPNGAKIAYLSNRPLDGSDTNNIVHITNIWVMNADGSGAIPVTRMTSANFANLNILDPVWSPDSSKIAFVSDRALDGSDAPNRGATNNIWVVNADGSGAQPLTRLESCLPLLTPSGSADSPSWSPDGAKIVFQSDGAPDSNTCSNGGSLSIWVMNADGSGAQRIGTGSNYRPVWSPDGHKIAFLSAFNIWVMNPDGSAPTPLTKLTSSSASGPIWSPDGRKLAFVSDRALNGSDAVNANGTQNVWLMNSDGSGAIPLTKFTAPIQPPSPTEFSYDPAWAPDSSMLAFSSLGALDGSDAPNPNGAANIWSVHADGSALMPLTKVDANSRTPSWHP